MARVSEFFFTKNPYLEQNFFSCVCVGGGGGGEKGRWGGGGMRLE